MPIHASQGPNISVKRYRWMAPATGGSDSKATLHLAIDNATGNVVGAYFQKEETLIGYYYAFTSRFLKIHGIPAKFLTDNRTVFYYETHKTKNRKSVMS